DPLPAPRARARPRLRQPQGAGARGRSVGARAAGLPQCAQPRDLRRPAAAPRRAALPRAAAAARAALRVGAGGQQPLARRDLVPDRRPRPHRALPAHRLGRAPRALPRGPAALSGAVVAPRAPNTDRKGPPARHLLVEPRLECRPHRRPILEPGPELAALRLKAEDFLKRAVSEFHAVGDRYEVPYRSTRLIVHPIAWTRGRTL